MWKVSDEEALLNIVGEVYLAAKLPRKVMGVDVITFLTKGIHELTPETKKLIMKRISKEVARWLVGECG